MGAGPRISLRSFLVSARFRLRNPAKFQAMAEVLSVCGVRDKPRPNLVQHFEGVFSDGINVEDFL